MKPKKGYIQVYTGEGKGKTTAALGLTLRAVGAGHRVFFAQFLKSGTYSEIRALDRLGSQVTLRQFGTGKFVDGEASESDRMRARRGLEESAEALRSGKFHLVVLDEANVALYYGLFEPDELLKAIDGRAENVEVVVTGRHAPPALLDKAHLVTEMRKVKHYADTGVAARLGIER